MRTIIDEELYKTAKSILVKLGKKGTVAKKMQSVIASYKHGISKASEVMGVSRASIYSWSKQIESGDFEGLVNKSKHQEGSKLKSEHLTTISKWLSEFPNSTIKEIKSRLLSELGVDVSKSTVHRAMQKSGFSYITGRKQHYQQDKEKVENFKK